MKKLTIDFTEYQQELDSSKEEGFQEGIKFSQEMVIEAFCDLIVKKDNEKLEYLKDTVATHSIRSMILEIEGKLCQ